jgi:predicted Rossmann-fold nucleotide-binding protein
MLLIFLKKYPKSVTFFGGTHFKEDAPEYQKARSVSARISKDLNYSIVTGGGPGIMEAANAYLKLATFL